MKKRIAPAMTAASVAMTFGVALGCASASINGGTLVARGAEPKGVTLGEWRMSACHDASGGELPDREGLVRVVKKGDGKLTLVEMRDDTDSVLVDNVSARAEDWVFALALARESGAQYFREYTVPKRGGGGRFVIAKEWMSEDTGDGFKGTYKVASVVCTLVPASSPA